MRRIADNTLYKNTRLIYAQKLRAIPASDEEQTGCFHKASAWSKTR